MLKLEEEQRNPNALRQHRGLHVRDAKSSKSWSVHHFLLIAIDYMGISEHLLGVSSQSGDCSIDRFAFFARLALPYADLGWSIVLSRWFCGSHCGDGWTERSHGLRTCSPQIKSFVLDGKCLGPRTETFWVSIGLETSPRGNGGSDTCSTRFFGEIQISRPSQSTSVDHGSEE